MIRPDCRTTRLVDRFIIPVLVCLFVAWGIDSPRLAAKTNAANQIELKTERIIVFKDGYFLVIKRGRATTDDDGAIYTNEVPDAAVLGTYWASSSTGRIKNFVSGWVEEEEAGVREVRCSQTLEILQANVSKECSVRLNDESSWNGVIENVLVQKTRSPIPPPMYSTLGIELPQDNATGSSAAATKTYEMSMFTGTHFVMATDGGQVLLPVSDVAQLTVPDMETVLEREVFTKTREKRLTFHFERPGEEHELVVMYFRPGVRWIPTYRLALDDASEEAKHLELDLQSELLNEAEDLIDTPIDIVVGVPNFRFRSLPSPLSLEQTLRNALAQAAPQLMQQFGNNAVMSNSMMTQQLSPVNQWQDFGGQGGEFSLPEELTTASSQDLFVYALSNMSLKRTDRAAVPILNAKIPYRDVHTWDVHMTRNDIATAPSGAGLQSPLQISRNKVWRQIEMKNATDKPWTTGAAMIMLGQQPLAQELLTYTSPGDVCRIPVTVAVDVRGTYRESETNRVLRALEWGGYHYTKVSQRADLRLVNRKSEPVDVEIRLRFGGRVDEASHDGTVEMAAFRSEDWTQYRGDPAVNNSSDVLWKVRLEPGEAFEPSVDYHFYARQ